MSRNKISEYRSKNIVSSIVGTPYVGWSIDKDLNGIGDIKGAESYVVKVDQAIKKRFKQGLVKLDVACQDVAGTIESLAVLGYEHFIVEPYVKHQPENEQYISFQRERNGILVSHSIKGGVDIEDDASTIESSLLNTDTVKVLSLKTGLSIETLLSFQNTFDMLHLGLLEINPYVIEEDHVVILDAAIEVDSVAAYLVKEWGGADIRYSTIKTSKEELFVRSLNDDSSASFNLSILNKDGSIFLLLSGGGASVVIADEIFSLGYGKEIANYGEYSGNPSRHETYLYTLQVLSLVINSSAKSKVLFIGGAIANFTDIATTFNGVIDALRQYTKRLAKNKVKVYVRRGGPHEKEGLRRIEEVLIEMNMLGGVYDPSVSIPAAVKKLIKGLQL